MQVVQRRGLSQEAKSEREEQKEREERSAKNQKMERRRRRVYNYMLKLQVYIKTTTTFVVGGLYYMIWILERGERMSTGRSFI